MEQVPHIAMYCQELPEAMTHIVPSHLLPLVVKFLTDTNNQVRKTSQAALLVLLEQGLVDKADVEDQVRLVLVLVVLELVVLSLLEVVQPSVCAGVYLSTQVGSISRKFKSV